MHCVCVVIARDCLLAKDPSGSSSDDGGFLPGAEGEGVGDSGHTLPVRNSRSVQSMSSHDVVGILFALDVIMTSTIHLRVTLNNVTFTCFPVVLPVYCIFIRIVSFTFDLSFPFNFAP